MSSKIKIHCLVVLLLFLLIALRAVEIYVAPTGDDASPGTEQKPLHTIQAGMGPMDAGDVCLVRGGTYREAVKIKTSGAPGQPLRLQAIPGEKVLFDGTESVMGKWEKYNVIGALNLFSDALQIFLLHNQKLLLLVSGFVSVFQITGNSFG